MASSNNRRHSSHSNINEELQRDPDYKKLRSDITIAQSAVDAATRYRNRTKQHLEDAENLAQQLSEDLSVCKTCLQLHPNNATLQEAMADASAQENSARLEAAQARKIFSQADRLLRITEADRTQKREELVAFVKQWREQREKERKQHEQKNGDGSQRKRKTRKWSFRYNSQANDERDAHVKQAFRTHVCEWRNLTLEYFSNYATMEKFPDPPVWKECREPACQAVTRALDACPCDVKAAFQVLSEGNLKSERLKWHPDKFSSCAEELRREFQSKAKEVFVVVDAMYQESR